MADQYVFNASVVNLCIRHMWSNTLSMLIVMKEHITQCNSVSPECLYWTSKELPGTEKKALDKQSLLVWGFMWDFLTVRKIKNVIKNIH